MSNTIHYIYCHTAPNGKRYIGQTSKEPERRWKNGWGYCRQPLFSKAIKKYGWENFRHEVLAVCCYQSTADYLERHYIDTFKTFSRDGGYNLTFGGGGASGHIVSEEMKQHLRELAKKRGISPAQRRAMDEAHRKNGYKGRRLSQEERKHLSDIHKGEGNWIYGKTHSAETKAKMSAARRGIPKTDSEKKRIREALLASKKIEGKRKPILQFDLEGNYIKRYESIVAAARELGKHPSNIHAVVKGKKDTAFGYIWKYEDEELQRQSDAVRHARKSKPSTKKPVAQYEQGGVLVSTYDSILEAQRVTGFAGSCIGACCKGRRRQAYGFVWKYQNDQTNNDTDGGDGDAIQA